MKYEVNLGGEGEILGVLNQQEAYALGKHWLTLQRKSFAESVADGHDYVICPNWAVALPDACVDTVYTNSVQIDVVTFRGPGVQSSEIRRILKSGGMWVRDGVNYLTKP